MKSRVWIYDLRFTIYAVFLAVVGRVTPCAPSARGANPGAHGVTRPTTSRLLYGGRCFCLVASLLLTLPTSAQILHLPPRATNALSGTAFTNLITLMSLTSREDTIYTNIVQGNVPNFLRKLIPITSTFTTNGATHTALYFVTADYLAVGSDADYFLCPMTPILAQKLANFMNCALPTRQMVNQIWTNAQVKMNPQPIPPSGAMTTVPVFADHNVMVRTQRYAFTNSFPLGALVSGDKKDVVMANRIFQQPAPKRVCIYGWHYTTGAPIQPLSTVHEETYADYSHGIRLAQTFLTVDGLPKMIPEVLKDTNLVGLLSDEGLILTSKYPITASAPAIVTAMTNRTTTTAGGTVSFTISSSGTGPLNYQWRFNGTNIAGERGSSLLLQNVKSSMAGDYTVFVSNAGGAVSNKATLTVSAPEIRLDAPAKTNSQFQCRLSGSFGDSYLVEASTNLVNWSPVYILSQTNEPALLSDGSATNSRRFYRASLPLVKTLADFEVFPNHNEVVFQDPAFSASTTNFLDSVAGTFAVTTNVFPANGSGKALQATWSFKTGTSNPWLRLTTFNATNLPNPTVAFDQALLFDVYANRDLYVAVGLRETGTTNVAGANGGTSGTIEWIGTTTTTPPRGKLVIAGQWTTLQFLIAQEPVRSFVGNGVLSSSNGRGVLEHLAFAPAAGFGLYTVFLDNFQVAELSP